MGKPGLAEFNSSPHTCGSKSAPLLKNKIPKSLQLPNLVHNVTQDSFNCFSPMKHDQITNMKRAFLASIFLIILQLSGCNASCKTHSQSKCSDLKSSSTHTLRTRIARHWGWTACLFVSHNKNERQGLGYACFLSNKETEAWRIRYPEAHPANWKKADSE